MEFIKLCEQILHSATNDAVDVLTVPQNMKD